jgi:hypothetical protein
VLSHSQKHMPKSCALFSSTSSSNEEEFPFEYLRPNSCKGFSNPCFEKPC